MSLYVYCAPCAILSILLVRHLQRKSKLPPPPGPKKLPLIGNLLQMPSEWEWETYMAWNSNIIHLNVAGTSIIVLSSAEAANDLLERRSAIYSDRPRLPMANEFLGWDFLWVCRRKHRQLCHQAFNPVAAQAYHPTEHTACHELLRCPLHNPENIMDHLRHMAGSVIMSVAYGINVLPQDDPFVALARDAIRTIVIATDTIPALKYVPDWFPGAGFKHTAKNGAENGKNSRSKWLRETSTWVGLTPVSALGTFFLAMLANPDAQKKAQAEIDSELLPYVSALIKEVMCWRSVTPIAIPHFLTVEDEYKGYRLPAGSIVIPNAWAMLHDEVMYPDPYAFKPERVRTRPRLRSGPHECRICPGRHMAQASIWINAVSILATFDITKAAGEDGQVIEPGHEYFSALVPSRQTARRVYAL
ncbi:cytochrome P450 [Mycena capillaripes]|nr:cytochrome P450 [Mycena capillaripes]